MTSPAPSPVSFPVLGVPVTYVTDHADVRDAVIDRYGAWDALDSAYRVNGVEVTVTVRRHTADETPCPPVQYDVPSRARMHFRCGGSHGTADAEAGVAHAMISASLLRTDVGGEQVLDALTFFLVTAHDRRPVHAAAVVINHTMFLLTGASGAGKSTLAYHAWRAGRPVRADDTVFIQRDPTLAVWTPPFAFRLAPDVASAQPELATRVPTRQPNGKDRVRCVGPPLEAAPYTGRVQVCRLERADRTRLSPRSAAELQDDLDHDAEPGFDLHSDDVHDVVQRLGPGWRLEWDDAAAAITALANVAD